MNHTDDDETPTGEHPAQTTPRDGGIRECFVPRPGYVYSDFSAIEIRALAQVEDARQKQEKTVRGLASTLQGVALAISLIDPLTLATHEFPRMYSPVRTVQTPEEVEAALKEAADRRAKKNERRAQRHKK